MNQNGKPRYDFLGIAFAVVGIAIIAAMIRIETSEDADVFRAQGESYRGGYETVYPERGSIYDRDEHLLAGNEKVYEVGINLMDVNAENDDPQAIATVINQVLGLDYADVLAKASTPFQEGTSVYYKIYDLASSDQVNQLEKLVDEYANAPTLRRGGTKPSLKALSFTPHLRRSYPEHTLAANVLGFYSFQDTETGKGYFGVEEKYNDLLSGTPQKIWVSNDPQLAKEVPTIPPGASLILTIDREIQSMVEDELDKALKSTGAVGGTIIILDPETGEVLSMAATPRMDPNEYWKYNEVYPDSTPFNRAVGTTYEPGSVFKVLTMASALDKGAVKPDTPFNDTGSFLIGGFYIHNWDGGAWGPQDMVGCMQHSLNVCLAWVATQLGTDNFYNYIRAFGIGHTTGIDLAGEVNYPLRLPGDNQWYDVDLGTNSFGQGIAVTPIQIATAISAVANDGKMMAPHVLKAMVDNGRQYNTTPQVMGTPISADTAHTLTSMLVTSLEKESSDALVPGYTMAGKTGTAEIPGPTGYSTSLTNASFVGWGPADDPKFLVYIWLEKPTSSQWGSVVAAPVFSDVVKKLVVLMNIPPDDVRKQLAVNP
ncbi:MAG: penicillin-binding protein 2 [Anaerolineaceae bacterium]